MGWGVEGQLPLATKPREGRHEEPATSDSADIHLIEGQRQIVLALGHPAVHIMQHLYTHTAPEPATM